MSSEEAITLPLFFNVMSLNDIVNGGWFMDFSAMLHLHENEDILHSTQPKCDIHIIMDHL